MASQNYVFVLRCVIVAFMMFNACETSIECTRKNNICELPEESSLRFFILGDFGGQNRDPFTTDIQLETAKQVDEESEKMRPHFFLTTGDNFYDDGVEDVSDPRFDETFENVYTYGKEKNIPWYISAGNHDHYGNIQAQVDYSYMNPRWVFPSQYYPIRYSIRGERGDVMVEFLVLDTVLLCGHSKSSVPGPANLTAAMESLRWLRKKLKESKADYLFVVGHYTIFATGRHEGEKCLANTIARMLIRYKVTAYIAGHNHHLQHFTMTDSSGWTTHLVTSGAAAKIEKLSSSTAIRPRPHQIHVTSMFSYFGPKDATVPKRGGYVYAEIDEVQAQFTFYRSDGLLLYTFSAGKRSEKREEEVEK